MLLSTTVSVGISAGGLAPAGSASLTYPATAAIGTRLDISLQYAASDSSTPYAARLYLSTYGDDHLIPYNPLAEGVEFSASQPANPSSVLIPVTGIGARHIIVVISPPDEGEPTYPYATDTLITGSAITITPPSEINVNFTGLSYASSVEAGQPLIITPTIHSPGAVLDESVQYFLSSDSTLDAGDIPLNNITTKPFYTGADNFFVAFPPPFRIPPTAPAGTYHIIGVIVPPDSPPQSVTSNDMFVGPSMSITAPALPDLSVQSIHFNPQSNPVAAGGQIQVEADVLDTHDTLSDFQVSYFLSADSIAGNADDILVRDYFIIPTDSPERGFSTIVPRYPTLIIPGDIAGGSYHIVAHVDPNSLISESDESNNYYITPDTITVDPTQAIPVVPPVVENPPRFGIVSGPDVPAPPTPDLSIEGIDLSPNGSPQSIQAGSDLAINTTIASNRTDISNFQTAYFLSRDTIMGNLDDIPITRSRQPRVPQIFGNKQIHSEKLAVPAGTPPGRYHLVALVDSSFSVAESDETNNAFITQDVVVVTGAPRRADFIIGFANAPESLSAGGSYNTNVVVRNVGRADGAGRFVVKITAKPVAGGKPIELFRRALNMTLEQGTARAIAAHFAVPDSLPNGNYIFSATVLPPVGTFELRHDNNTFSLMLPGSASFGDGLIFPG
jgi:hypothetical protein